MKKNSAISRIFAAVLTVCMVFGMLPVTTFAFQSESTKKVEAAYQAAADGDLLYGLNFNFDSTFTNACSGTSAGTFTVSEDGAKVSVSDKSASPAFYGGRLYEYKIPNKIYTVSFYLENSDWTTLSAGMWFFTRNTYIGFASNPDMGGQMCLIRNNAFYEPLDGDVEFATDAEQNNRRYFKTVIDGVHGILQFYALSVNDTYELLGSVDIDLNYNIHSPKYHLYLGMHNGFEVISADQTISLGDVKLYKGNTAAEKSDYQNSYDDASDGDVLIDVDFNDLLNYTDGWGAFLESQSASASEDGASVTVNNGSLSAVFPDKTGAHYGSMTYEFYVESDSPVGMWFMGNTAGGNNYRMGFSFFNTEAPENLFFVDDAWYSADTYASSEEINRTVYRDIAVLESQFGTETNIDQSPDTRADDPTIEHNVKIEFDAKAKKITAFILKDGAFKESVSLYYAAMTYYPIFGIYQPNADAVTTVDNFTVKKGLTSGIEEIGVKFDHFLIHDNNSNDSVHPDGIYKLSDDTFDTLPMSISVWVNLSRDGYGEESYIFDYFSPYRFACTVDVGVPSVNYMGTVYKFSGVKIARETWTHLAITCGDGDNGTEIRCYINGTLAQTLTAAATVEPRTEIGEIPAEIYLGSYMNEMNRYPFEGYMGDIALYSDVRTAEEVLADMTEADVNDEALLVKYDLFDYSYRQDIPDASGNGYDIPFSRTWLTEEDMEEKRAEDPVEYAGSVAVIPDTQYCLDRSPDSFPPIFDYLLESSADRKVQQVLHVGDITDRNSTEEWTVVKQQYDRLNGIVPYVLSQGNHDRYTAMNSYFGSKDGYYYQYLKENGGLYDDNSIVNSYVLFTIGKVDYIVLNIGYERGEAVLNWAEEILDTYSDRRAIIVSHSTLSGSSAITTDGGTQMWSHMKKHPNVIMILGGHTTGDSLTDRVDVGDYGNTVYQARVDAQHSDLYFDGLGMIAYFNFSEDGEDVSVEYYSTRTGLYYREDNQFTFSFDCYDSPLDGDHVCDACGNDMTVCADENKDHVCDTDSTCTAYTDSHTDADGNHFCEYCGNGVKGANCTDADGDGDHKCDTCGADALNECVDSAKDGDHTCDECAKAGISQCSDADHDGDHKCDDCEKVVTKCADTDADHYCDECNLPVKGSGCTDASGDGDHKCDICGAEKVSACSDSLNDGDHLCDECGEKYVQVVNYSGTSAYSGQVAGYLGGMRYDGFLEKVRYFRVIYNANSHLPLANRSYEVSWWTEDSAGCSVALSLVYGTYGSVTSNARWGWRTVRTNAMVFYYNDNDVATVTTPERDVIDGRQYFKAVVNGVSNTISLYVLSDGEYKLADTRTFNSMAYFQLGIHNATVVLQEEHMAVGDLSITELCSDTDGDFLCEECGGRTHDCIDENADNACDICGDVASYVNITDSDGNALVLKDLKGGDVATMTLGDGTATYDANTAIVTLDGITAKALNFYMNGDFTLNVKGTNNVTAGIKLLKGGMTVDGDGILNSSGASPALYVNGGNYYKQIGATVNLKSSGNHGLASNGKNIIIEGGTLNAYATGKYGITAQNGGAITISGGTVISSATEQPLLVNKTSAKITITGGTVTLTSRSGSKNCMYGHGGVNITGGNITITAPSGNAIRTNGTAVTISGGNINVKSGKYAIYSTGATISGGTITSAATHFAYVTSGKTLALNGGSISGSGSYLMYLAGSETVSVSSSVDIDFNATVAPFYHATEGALTLTFAEDVQWEEGKTLADVTEALHIKTVDRADYSAVEQAIADAEALNPEWFEDFTSVTDAINAVVYGKYVTEQTAVDAMAQAINDALNALVYLSADYTEVNAALEQANALNPKVYKDFSAVTAAINDVVTGLNITEQEQVDAMAAALNEAMANLEKLDNVIVITDTDGTVSTLWDEKGGASATATLLNGSITYDADTQIVTLNNVSTRAVEFLMTGDFTLNLVGDNTFKRTSQSNAMVVTTGNMTVDGDGTLLVSGSQYCLVTNGTLTLAGGTVNVQSSGKYTMQANGGLTLCGATLNLSGTSNLALIYGAGLTMTDGKLYVANSGGELIRINAGVCKISGGSVEINGTQNLIITETGISVNITGGTVDLTATSQQCINSGANITISQANSESPTIVTLNAKTHALRLNKANRTCSILGGTVKGSGTHFIFTNTNSTVNVGVDAVIDFNSTVKPFTDADDVYTVTLNTDGVLWEYGKELTDADVPTHIMTRVAYDAIDVVLNATVTISANTVKESDFEFVLMNGDEVLQTVKNDANGAVAFTLPFDATGVYTYTVKQVKGEAAGVTYDESVYTVTVTVTSENGTLTATVDTTPAFQNSYKVPFAAGEIVDGKYIVTETAKATEMGLIKIGDDHYYVGPNGVLVTSQKYYAWRLNENCTDINVGWYYFNAEGKLVTDGIVDGYYYVDGKPTEKGLFEYEGNYYVAQYDGKIITDRYFVWKIDESASQFATGWYDFNEDGTIIPWKNGIHDGYYYVNDKPTEMGLFEYEGKYYVAQYDGKIITGKYYVWKTQEGLEGLKGWRYFDETTGELLNGVVGEYYYEDGKRVDKGLIEWDGSYYFAQSGGKLVTSENYTKYGAGKYYVWKVDESAKDAYSNGWYYFDENGRLIQD